MAAEPKSERFKVLLEWDEDAQAWVTEVPALDSISTFGDTREEALQNTREAISGYLAEAADMGYTPSRSHGGVATGPEAEVMELEVAFL